MCRERCSKARVDPNTDLMLRYVIHFHFTIEYISCDSFTKASVLIKRLGSMQTNKNAVLSFSRFNYSTGMSNLRL